MISLSSVGYATDDLQPQALELAKLLGYTLEKDADTCLFVAADQLALKMKHFSPLVADFSAASWTKRKAEGKKQGLVRACKPSPGLKIIDATAGWGRDAAVLASFGAEVLMLERHPVMGLLLADALSHQSDADRNMMHLSLCKTDTITYLSGLDPADYPDVIYIDPMHPVRTKSALVKKDMQALQEMVGADEDALDLLLCAVGRVKQRVVVKWPQKAKPLLKADACIEGKTVRFDIYTSQRK